MANDKTISALTSFDPMKDGQLLLVSEQKDGAWKSGKVSTNSIAQYVMPEVLGKLKGADNITVLPTKDDPEHPEKITGYQITHTLDTQLFVVCPGGRPKTGASNKIYLVPDDSSSTGENIYIEWAYAENKWEEIGRRQVETDLSGYYTKVQVDAIKTELQTSINTVDGKVSTNTTNIAANAQDITSLSRKVTALETESAKHALSTDLDKVKTAQQKDAADIVTLNTKIGKHTVPADGETAEVPGTGLLKELEDLEAGYKAADTLLSSRIKANEDKLKTVATTEALNALKTTVTNHGTEIANLKTTSGTHATKSEVSTKVAEVDAKFANYVTTEVYDAHLISVSNTYETKTDVAEKLALKANKSDLDSLSTKVTNLDDTSKNHQTAAQVQTAITTATAGLASEDYVNQQIAKADITGKLTEYAKTADVASTYATKTSVEDITKTDGTIDTKVNAAKADLQKKLDTANATIADLTTKLQALTDKLAKYDARFGYNAAADTWSKSFLLIEE